jgi:uncharacterized protein (TIGR03083 family)
MMSETSTDNLVSVLHASQDRLAAALDGVSAEQAATQSYDDDWTVAQVASHLGSGAELFTLFLEAGLEGEPAPGVEAMQPIWDEWNEKDALSQVRDAVAVNEAFLERIDALTEARREAWALDLFGSQRTFGEFLRMRLSEHAVHTWDIVVSFHPAATISQDAAAYVLDNLAAVAGWTGQKHDDQISVEVRTTAPELAFHLDLGPAGVGLAPSPDDTDAGAVLTLPAESFIRLVYGRLDPDHTPEEVQARGVDLDLLRRTFPGF